MRSRSRKAKFYRGFSDVSGCSQVIPDIPAVPHLFVRLHPVFVLGDDVATGRLLPLLPDHDSPAHPIHAVYLEGRTLPAKIRALIAFASEDIRSQGMA